MAPERDALQDIAVVGGQAEVAPGRAAAWLSKQVELGLTDVGLSVPQYRVLALLSEGSAISSIMARRLAVRPPSVSSLIDGLVGRGLVERRHNEDDRRTVSHQLTPAGRHLLAEADQAVDDRLAEIARSLPDQDAIDHAFEGLQLWQQAITAHFRARLATG